MALETIPNDVVDAIHSLIRRFIKRRCETVILAMIDLRPDIIMDYKFYKYHEIDMEVTIEKAEKIRKDIRGASYDWDGVWNNEWKYHLHGDGCELTHLRTNERYDWDVNDPNIFFTGQLISYLDWIKSVSVNDVNVITYKSWEKESSLGLAVLLECLVEKNVLATSYLHEWQLLNESF